MIATLTELERKIKNNIDKNEITIFDGSFFSADPSAAGTDQNTDPNADALELALHLRTSLGIVDGTYFTLWTDNASSISVSNNTLIIIGVTSVLMQSHNIAQDQQAWQRTKVELRKQGETLDITILIQLKGAAPQWQLIDSFPNLYGIYPFNQLESKNSVAIYTNKSSLSFAVSENLFDETINNKQSIMLKSGLNIASFIHLNLLAGLLDLLNNFIESKAGGEDLYFLFYGAVTINSRDLPSFRLKTKLDAIYYKDFSFAGKSFLPEINTSSSDNAPVAENGVYLVLDFTPSNPVSKLPESEFYIIWLTNSIEFRFNFSLSEKMFAVSARVRNQARYTLADMAKSLPIGDSMPGDYIPSEFSWPLDQVGLRFFTMVFKLSNKIVSLQRITLVLGAVPNQTESGLSLTLGDIVELQDAQISIDIFRPFSSDKTVTAELSATARILYEVFKGEFYFYGRIERENKNTKLTDLYAKFFGKVPVNRIITEVCIGKEDCPYQKLPDFIKNLEFGNFGASYAAGDTDGKLEKVYQVYGSMATQMPFMDQQLRCMIEVMLVIERGSTKPNSNTNVSTAKNNVKRSYEYELLVSGVCWLGRHMFSLNFQGSNAADSGSTVLTASWQVSNGKNIKLKEIATSLGFPNTILNDIPDEFNIDLTGVYFRYDIKNNRLFVACDSKNYGTLLLLAAKKSTTDGVGSKSKDVSFAANAAADDKNLSVSPKEKWRFFIRFNFNKKLLLNNINLFKSFIPEDTEIGVTQLAVVAASADFDASFAKELNQDIKEFYDSRPAPENPDAEVTPPDSGKKIVNYPTIPLNDGQGMTSGAGLLIMMQLAQWEYPAVLRFGKQAPAPRSRVSRAVAAAASASATQADEVLPALPEENDSFIWVDIEKSVGPLSIEKFGFGYRNRELKAAAHMSITLGGLSIGLLGFGFAVNITDYKIRPTLQGMTITYAADTITISGGLMGTIDPVDLIGQVMIKVGNFGISAIAGYTSYQYNPSLFVYAVLNAPLGGPPFFFVTGVAGGFGFNRTLITPSVDKVKKYALIEWARPGKAPSGAGSVAENINSALTDLSTRGVIAPKLGQYWLATGILFTSFEIVQATVLAIAKFGKEFEVTLLGMASLRLPNEIPGLPVEPVVFAELQINATFKPAEGLIGISGQLSDQSYVLSPDCHLTGGFAYYMWIAGPHAGNFILTMGGYNATLTLPDFYPQVPRLGAKWRVSDKLSVKGELYVAITPAAAMIGGVLSAAWNSGSVKVWFNFQFDAYAFYRPFYYQARMSVNFGVSVDIVTLLFRKKIDINVQGSLEIWGPKFSGLARFNIGIITIDMKFGADTLRRPLPLSWDQFLDGMLKLKRPGKDGVNAQEDKRDALYCDVTQGLIKQFSAKDTPPPPDGIAFVVDKESAEFTVKAVIPIKTTSFDQLTEVSAGVPVRNTAFGIKPAAIKSNDFSSNCRIRINKLDGAVSEQLSCTPVLEAVPVAFWDADRESAPDNPIIQSSLENVVTGYRIYPMPKPINYSTRIIVEKLRETVPETGTWGKSDAAGMPDKLKNQNVKDTIYTDVVTARRKQLIEKIKTLYPGIVTEPDLDTYKHDLDLWAAPELGFLGERRNSA